jgi:hypothetical protein
VDVKGYLHNNVYCSIAYNTKRKEGRKGGKKRR